MDTQLIGATPTMEMVKYRLICLAWLTKRWRIECQLHIDPSAYSRGDLTRRFYRARTVGHLGEARVYLTTLEKQLITQRFGSWQVGYLNWGLSQAEALGALLWAENQYPIFHDWLTPFPIKTCCQITTPLIMPFLPHVPLKLRRLRNPVHVSQ